MNGFGSLPNQKQSNTPTPQANPFARALSEIEPPNSDGQNNPNAVDSNPFAQALSQAKGGEAPENQLPANPADMLKQQEDQARKERLKLMRRKLHDQINPVDAHSIYSARELQTKREIDEIRKELRLLAQDVAAFDKQIELTLMTEVAPGSVGKDGSYFKNFFAQLRAFIMLLRQKIKSAGTWAQQTSQRKKKKRKGGAGLEIKGGKADQTKTVFDMMHHERSSTYGGS